MADLYSKKPTVTRFKRKATYAGRDVKRAVVSRRVRPMKNGHEVRPMKPMK